MAVYVTHKDDEALATGTHEGANGASALYVRDMDFRICGIMIGSAIHNDTQVTDGLVTEITKNTVTDDTNTWNNGDAYSIYKTAAKDTVISKIATDKSRGWKVTQESELNTYGWKPEDVDIDKDEDGYLLPKKERPFGPGQPESITRKR